MRYFISYENLVNNSELEKEVNVFSEELKLVYKKNDEKYLIEPLTYFTRNKLELSDFIKEVEEKRKDITFMVELTEDEAKKVHPIFLKRFNNNVLLNPDKTIRLLDKNVANFMDYKELSNGRYIYLKSNDNNTYTLSLKEQNIKRKKDSNIGEGEYFYTEVERTIEKYSDKVTEIENISRNTYKIKKHKMIVIDSIGQDRVIGLSRGTYSFLYRVCFDSKPIYIKEKDEDYVIYSHIVNNSKKAYILENNNLSSLIYDSAIKPLFKYINIYELVDGVYKRIPLQEYINENILEYTKKPSNN